MTSVVPEFSEPETKYSGDVKLADVIPDEEGDGFDISVSCEKWEKGSVGTIFIKAMMNGREVIIMSAPVSGGNIDQKTGQPFTHVTFRGDWDSLRNTVTEEKIVLRPEKIWVELKLKQEVDSAIDITTARIK